MTARQIEALQALATFTSVDSGCGSMRLDTARALQDHGFAVVNEFCGTHGDAKKVTHWNARITDAGRAAALAAVGG
jgi:hypothetical protein